MIFMDLWQLKSKTGSHDELDFEFLGSKKPPYLLRKMCSQVIKVVGSKEFIFGLIRLGTSIITIFFGKHIK